MTKKTYTINLVGDDGIAASETFLLDDKGLEALMRGIAVARAESVDIWEDAPWTKDQAIDEYSECLANWKKYELIQQTVETTSELELYEFMVNCNSDEDDEENEVDEDEERENEEFRKIEDEDDRRRIVLGEYVSGDDVELDPETAKQYQADRRADDVPEDEWR